MDALKREDATSAAPRQRVYNLIRDHPGISISEIARRMDNYWTSAAFHVKNLERAGLVETRRTGRRRLVFPSNGKDAQELAQDSLLAEPQCVRVASAIVAHPGRRVPELCRLTGMSARAVYHHVKRLADAGLVTWHRQGASRRAEPLPSLSDRFASLQKGDSGHTE